jgi:subtilase family serine protease
MVLGFFVILAAFFLVTSNSFAKEDNNARVCPGSMKDSFRCHARVISDEKGNPKISIAPSGYGPLQFLKAYSLTGRTLVNQTIAIVDAYDQPSMLQDLNAYSKQFGIPTMSGCSVASGSVSSPCFQKVNQNGGNSYPNVNSGWALETSLDVEVVHAICQNCNILLVEANSASYYDLMAAVDRARLMGAKVISNSYGSDEFSSEGFFDSYFNYPGIAFTFSSGDSGYKSSYPAGSRYVTSVGGTTLNLDSNNNYLSETAWGGSGSGCSLYESKPSWQTDSFCANRTIADVSADADPGTGAAIYDSVRYQGKKGWFQVGGTSLSSPLIAGTYALSGNTGNSSTYANSIPYSGTAFLRDVNFGSNGSCGGTYLCTSVVGYDGPTGLGTPNGTGGF